MALTHLQFLESNFLLLFNCTGVLNKLDILQCWKFRLRKPYATQSCILVSKNINQFISFDLIWHLKETKSFQQQKISQNIILLGCHFSLLELQFYNPSLTTTVSFNTKRVPHSLFPAVVWKTVDVGLNLEKFAVEPSAGLPGFGTWGCCSFQSCAGKYIY